MAKFHWRDRCVWLPAGLIALGWVALGSGVRHRQSTVRPQISIPASNGQGVTSHGTHVQLVALHHINTQDWEHWWSPNGGPLNTDPFNQPWQPRQEKDDDSDSHQTICLRLSSEAPSQVDAVLYVPGMTLADLVSWDDPRKPVDQIQTLQINKFENRMESIFLPKSSTSDLFVGIADGEWKSLGFSKPAFGKAPYKGRIVLSGSWGTGKVIRDMNSDTLAIAARSVMDGLVVELKGKSGILDTEFRVKATDSVGKELPLYTAHNLAHIPLQILDKIQTIEIQARPFEYVEFKEVHFDRDADLWKNIVWGSAQTGKSLKLGETEITLAAVAQTAPDDHEWNRDRYVQSKLYTVDGKEWRAHPEELNGAVSGKRIDTGQYNPVNHAPLPAREISAPYFGVLKIQSVSGPDTPDFFIQSGGSDSDIPGKNFHQEWNQTPLTLNDYGRMRPLQPKIWASFALSQPAKFGQVKVQIAEGSWKAAAEIKPDPNEIKPAGPDLRKLTLMVGDQIHWIYEVPNYKWKDRVASPVNLKNLETRVSAVLKSGRKIPLVIHSYRQDSSDGALQPCFDFDRDAEVTEGDMICLRDVDKILVEARPIQTGYLVVPPPPTN